jgi:putative membrane protein
MTSGPAQHGAIAPPLFEAALRSAPLHPLEHACFLLTSALFWWTLARREGRVRVGHGAAALYVVAMAAQSTLLGALLTFSTTPWYPAYSGAVAAWGHSPATDQQLAGLIMWIPAGTPLPDRRRRLLRRLAEPRGA